MDGWVWSTAWYPVCATGGMSITAERPFHTCEEGTDTKATSRRRTHIIRSSFLCVYQLPLAGTLRNALCQSALSGV